jgi:hypothetical protein
LPTIAARNVSNPGTEPEIALVINATIVIYSVNLHRNLNEIPSMMLETPSAVICLPVTRVPLVFHAAAWLLCRLVSVRKGRQERHDLVFFMVGQTQTPNRSIKVLGNLRGGPARYLLPRIAGCPATP